MWIIIEFVFLSITMSLQCPASKTLLVLCVSPWVMSPVTWTTWSGHSSQCSTQKYISLCMSAGLRTHSHRESHSSLFSLNHFRTLTRLKRCERNCLFFYFNFFNILRKLKMLCWWGIEVHIKTLEKCSATVNIWSRLLPFFQNSQYNASFLQHVCHAAQDLHWLVEYPNLCTRH